MFYFPIVDSHVHLLDRSRFGYGWTAGSPALDGDFAIDDLVRAAKPYEIEGLVFVEAAVDAPGRRDEADWVDKLAESDKRLKGAVVSLPMEQGAALEAEIARVAALKTTRGVRRLIQHEADPDFALRPDFIAALKLLPKYKLTFDICVYHHQLGAALEMARRCPEVSFVLDHIGKPSIKDGLQEPWRATLADIAKMPNVACKLSGLTTEADHAAWTPAQLRPYIDWVLAAVRDRAHSVRRRLAGVEAPASSRA